MVHDFHQKIPFLLEFSPLHFKCECLWIEIQMLSLSFLSPLKAKALGKVKLLLVR